MSHPTSFQWDASAPSFVPRAHLNRTESWASRLRSGPGVKPVEPVKAVAATCEEKESCVAVVVEKESCVVKEVEEEEPSSSTSRVVKEKEEVRVKETAVVGNTPPATVKKPASAVTKEPTTSTTAAAITRRPLKGTSARSLADIARPPATLSNLDGISAQQSKKADVAVTVPSATKRRVYTVEEMYGLKDKEECKVLQDRQDLPEWALKGGEGAPSGSRFGINSLLEYGKSSKNIDNTKYQMPAALMRKPSAGGGREVDWSRRSQPRSGTTPTSGTTTAAPAVMPEIPAESWQFQQDKEKKDGDRGVKIVRQLRAQLNKMTPKTYESIFKAILHIGIHDLDEAASMVKLIFDKAITNHQYIDMYADLCGELELELQNRGVVKPAKDSKSMSNFKNLLIKQCQDTFKEYLGSDFVAPEGLDEDEEFELLLEHKKKMKGNLMFVACLAQAQLIKPKILLYVLNQTLDSRKPLQLEALASFLPSCAPAVYKSKRAPEFFDYLQRCREVVADETVDRRVRYLLMDALEEIEQMNLEP